MCGFLGLHVSRFDQNDHGALIRNSSHLLSHRGPDSEGHFASAITGTYLSHKRLRVIDLSEAAKQPFLGEDKSLLVFNGEIYNYLEISRKLTEYRWKSNSDTEVLAASLQLKGVEETLKNVRGQFAFSWTSADMNHVVIARDAFGEKPLYYFLEKGVLCYGSEIGAVRRVREALNLDTKVNRESAHQYLQIGYVSGHDSIFEGINRVLPGSVIEFHRGDVEWKMDNSYFWHRRWTGLPEYDPPTLLQVECSIEDAVLEQLVSDVPIGTFLSGGVDSSLITALAAKHRLDKLHTFSIGFPDRSYDESSFALAASEAIGTIHHAHVMSDFDAEESFTLLDRSFTEPLGDPSQLPTVYLAARAREYVTVALSGDGGDEFFFGYERYKRYINLTRQLGLVRPVLDVAGSGISRVASEMARKIGAGSLARRLERLNNFIKAVDKPQDRYMALVGYRHILESLLTNDFFLPNPTIGRNLETQEPFASLRSTDVYSYLSDDILVKVDRAAMAVSLESRAPFLDIRVTDMAAALSQKQLFGGGEPKHILKEIAAKYVPEAIIYRPKMGFGPPIDRWMRTIFASWAKEQLTDEFFWADLGIDPKKLSRFWQAHLTGDIEHGTYLWALARLRHTITRKF